MPVIRTVCGDITPEELGICYPHEHVLGAPPPDLATPDLMLTDEDAACTELGSFREAGGRAVVDMSTVDYNRDAAGLRRISEATGIHIICATGFNKDPFSARYVSGRSAGDLAALFTREVTEGIEPSLDRDGAGIRAGLIKASSTLNAISPSAETVFHAAAQAHLATGAPISTHTEAGTMALEQIALLQADGVSPGRMIIGHMDRRLDWDYHLAVAQTGAYLGYDQIGKEKYDPDGRRIEYILRLVDAGHGRQLLLSGDLARRSYWPAYGSGGGPGLTNILRHFIPRLRQAGLPESAIDDLLIHNPARALSISE